MSSLCFLQLLLAGESAMKVWGAAARKSGLLASASMIAMAVACTDVSAADLPVFPTKAPPIVKDQWTWWVEGGFTGPPAGDPSIGLLVPAIASFRPGAGWEAAIGFDYKRAEWSPYHISMQFRYGENNGGSSGFNGGPFPITLVTLTGSPTPANVFAQGSDRSKENHWLVDFAVGRDFALGSGIVQGKLGIRVAEITSTAAGNGKLWGCLATTPISAFPFCTQVNGDLAFQSRSRFLGVGPRVGVEGSEPLGGSWVFEYLGGAAVLFGDQTFSATQMLNAVSTGGAVIVTPNTTLSQSGAAAVFNLDAQIGISYRFTRNFKLMASYRFDGYWGALKGLETNGSIGNQDRFYYGPMLRATFTF
jgi:hypothetical protein